MTDLRGMGWLARPWQPHAARKQRRHRTAWFKGAEQWTKTLSVRWSARTAARNAEYAVVCVACDRPIDPTAHDTAPVVAQPAPAKAGINTHFVGSLLATLLIFMPFGIVALVFSQLARMHMAAGDRANAHRAADIAGRWLVASIVMGVLIGGLILILAARNWRLM